MSPERIFPVFFAFAMLSMAGAGFFFVSRNATLKRQLWPPFVIGIGVVLLALGGYAGFPATMFLVAIPVVALATFLNVRAMRFCDACGRTAQSPNPLSPARFCAHCGAALHL